MKQHTRTGGSSLQAALEHLMQGRTTVNVTHRLAPVRRVGRIAEIEHGRLVAMSLHQQLLTENALYTRLAALQCGLNTQTASALYP